MAALIHSIYRSLRTASAATFQMYHHRVAFCYLLAVSALIPPRLSLALSVIPALAFWLSRC